MGCSVENVSLLTYFSDEITQISTLSTQNNTVADEVLLHNIEVWCAVIATRTDKYAS